MLSHERICDRIFRLAGRRRTEVIVTSTCSALTRFADNVISQNVADTATEISVRVLDNGRVAKFSLNQPSEASLRTAFSGADLILKTQKKDPRLLPLPRPAGLKENRSVFFPGTADLTPSDRAARAVSFAGKCRRAGAVGFGTFENGTRMVTVANSLGLRAFHRETYAAYSVTARHGDGFGWAQDYSCDSGRLDFERVDRAALDKALRSAGPRAVPPGRYTVILEPSAVANLLLFLGIYGFGARFYQEGQSFVSGRLGKKVLNDKLTITDDAAEGPSAGMPFDYEGVPKRRLVLVDKGVARDLAHDRQTAREAGVRTTGHALPMPNTYGPLPSNLVMAAGDRSLKEMIRSTKKGILVTSFHYCNPLKPITLEMTGMTRNGTFMIENGRISYPVKNLRFTESVADAFNRVEAVGDRLESFLLWGTVSAPALKIKDFNFSSATMF